MQVERRRPSGIQASADDGARIGVWMVIGFLVVFWGAVVLTIIYKASTQPEPVEKCAPDMFGRGCEVTVEREQ